MTDLDGPAIAVNPDFSTSRETPSMGKHPVWAGAVHLASMARAAKAAAPTGRSGGERRCCATRSSDRLDRLTVILRLSARAGP